MDWKSHKILSRSCHFWVGRVHSKDQRIDCPHFKVRWPSSLQWGSWEEGPPFLLALWSCIVSVNMGALSGRYRHRWIHSWYHIVIVWSHSYWGYCYTFVVVYTTLGWNVPDALEAFGRDESSPCLNHLSGDYLWCLGGNVIPQKPGTLLDESESHLVLSDSLRRHGLDSPWNSPGQNTEVGGLSPLQGIFPTQELNRGLLHCRRILYQLSYKGSP